MHITVVGVELKVHCSQPALPHPSHQSGLWGWPTGHTSTFEGKLVKQRATAIRCTQQPLPAKEMMQD
jgi:hypothetical protein